VRQALALLVRNWPLKIAALALAILLYGVLVVGQNARIFPGSIPIKFVNEPVNAVLLSNLPNVTEVRYLASDPNVRVDSTSFSAVVNLTGIDPAAGTVAVGVSVSTADDRIRVIGWSPDRIQIQIDSLATKSVPVQVKEISVPPGFNVGQSEVSQSTVTVKGPSATVNRVDHAEARVQIDPAGFDFDRDVDLVAVDELGEVVPPPVRVDPLSVHVRIPVFTNHQSRSLPVTPSVTGTPAPGFEIAGVAFTPLIVNVQGDAEQLAALNQADTAPVSVNGASDTVHATVGLALPAGVVEAAETQIDVTVTIRPVSATRTFSAGITLRGARSDRTYQLSTDQVLVTIGGSVADLDGLQGQTLQLIATVTGLTPGSHQVKLASELPAGLRLVSASPRSVAVVVGVPSPSPSPGPTTAPSAAP
jgi:YbbR domain-containing protein